MEKEKRSRPNVLITGTPGVGKSSLAEAVHSESGLNFIDIGKLLKEKELYAGYDEERGSHILDEDLLCDELEEQMQAGGVIVDYHGCDFFPERWFDLVVVLRTSNDILFGRLEKRGYAIAKVTENVEAEIMQVVRDEAFDSYEKSIILELQSNTSDDMTDNVDVIAEWIRNFKK
mmetsp:Transcript_27917/g.78084  ORF Transcript_27917/g.78084 Transcript_27917/m.78084 type:complete len:174 (-) Transcript_27917:1241-1762(-)